MFKKEKSKDFCPWIKDILIVDVAISATLQNITGYFQNVGFHVQGSVHMCEHVKLFLYHTYATYFPMQIFFQFVFQQFPAAACKH